MFSNEVHCTEVYWSTWLQNHCWIHHAVPFNAILMRQDEATNESIAKLVDCTVACQVYASNLGIIIALPRLNYLGD
jgi:hypothetical protein